ncbi:MAG: 5'/3'-nucleotidase SurE [Candidatus Krumholzibacteria bacterium]|nr:5'/3'-nucleotidase SurE [Candidatus Krumholzibacteria bacterium]
MSTTILVTNDDGYDAPGIKVLVDAVAGLGTVYVVAPDREQSASSHSLTLRKRIGTELVAEQHYRVHGTPTDCVLLGVNGILKRKPDLIISGINHGPNMGEDVTYSGTVAAAFEGTILGVPSLAISSLQRGVTSDEAIRKVARVVVEAALQLGVPEDCLLNVNIPDPSISSIKGVRITKLGSRAYDNLLQKETGHEHDVSYTIGGDDPIWKDDDGTDISAVRMGYVSVTPLHLDLTHYKAIVEMERWRFAL